MKTALLLSLFIILSVTEVFSQYYSNQNKVWAFGKKAGLDFNSGSPVPISTGIDQVEGCASVCSSSGSLLFYTDGKKVYNNAGTVMPSGASITPYSTSSTSQAALIVPFIENPNRYYIFSLESTTSDNTARLVYSIVDMSLEGGMGDVVAFSTGIATEDSLSEKMIAVRGNNNNIWLLTHKRDTAVFLAYEISLGGISTTPVASATGTLRGPLGYAIGVIKASPDRRKIVSQSYAYSTICALGTELYDFDPMTGIVSNCRVLDSSKSQYGTEFSPDNTKLYVQQLIINNQMKICQYNIALPDVTAIKASKTDIANINTANATDLKLAPDHKIYMFGTDDSTKSLFLGYSRFLDCISNPNQAGSLCGYIPYAIKLVEGTGIRAGLPNVYVSTDTASNVNDISQNLPAISLFPNPATTELTITAPEKTTHLRICNMMGQEVYHNEYNAGIIKVDISTLLKGVYLVKVNGIARRRFVKE